jgi:hypothetical protein
MFNPIILLPYIGVLISCIFIIYSDFKSRVVHTLRTILPAVISTTIFYLYLLFYYPIPLLFAPLLISVSVLVALWQLYRRVGLGSGDVITIFLLSLTPFVFFISVAMSSILTFFYMLLLYPFLHSHVRPLKYNTPYAGVLSLSYLIVFTYLFLFSQIPVP